MAVCAAIAAYNDLSAAAECSFLLPCLSLGRITEGYHTSPSNKSSHSNITELMLSHTVLSVISYIVLLLLCGTTLSVEGVFAFFSDHVGLREP